MKNDNGLPDYLASLPEEHRQRSERLGALVGARTRELPASVAPFVFLPNQAGHPEFDDAAVVFWRAVEELYLAAPRRDQEIPLRTCAHRQGGLGERPHGPSRARRPG